MSIQLITDSTCDLTPEYLSSRKIHFEPLKVIFSDAEYSDKIDLSTHDFYKKMAISSQLPTTSQVNTGEFERVFLETLNAGQTVLGLFISSDLSGTYQAATIARSLIIEQHPEYLHKIHLIDSRTTSFGLGLLVILAKDLIDQGYDIQKITEILEDHIPRQQLYGLLNNLDNLVKGGRLSSSSAFIGNLINLKPIIEVKHGKVNVAHKARGTKRGIQWMIDQLTQAYPDKKIPHLAYAYAHDLSKLEALKQLIESSFKVENSYTIEIGPVVGTHVGQGAVGIVYFKTL